MEARQLMPIYAPKSWGKRAAARPTRVTIFLVIASLNEEYIAHGSE